MISTRANSSTTAPGMVKALRQGESTARRPWRCRRRRAAVPHALALSYVEAPAPFGSAMYSAFDRVTLRERMVYVHRSPVEMPRVPRGVTVRRLTSQDAPALEALDGQAAWIHATRGRPVNFAASGYGWGAFDHDGIVSLACTRFRGSAYEDIAVLTHPDRRHERLALARVSALTADITARGRTVSWCCSRDNRAGLPALCLPQFREPLGEFRGTSPRHRSGPHRQGFAPRGTTMSVSRAAPGSRDDQGPGTRSTAIADVGNFVRVCSSA